MTTSNDQTDTEPATAADRIEHEIDETRADLEAKVGELAARGRAATDLPAQLRRHPWAFAAAGAVLIGGTAGFLVWRRRSARSASGIAASARAAVQALKERVPHERPRESESAGRSVTSRVLLAVLTGAASAIAHQAFTPKPPPSP